MGNEVILVTQIVGIITYVGILFGLYKHLANAKDGTIETLKTHVAFLDAKIKDLSEKTPDVLLVRTQNREESLTKELEKAEDELKELKLEKAQLAEKMIRLEKELTEPDSISSPVKKEIVHQLIINSKQEAIVEHQQNQITNRIEEIKHLHHFNSLSGFTPELTPLQKENIIDIVNHLGIDFVINSRFEELNQRFCIFYQEIMTPSNHRNLSVGGGSMTGFRVHGIINNDNNLTPFGASTFKIMASKLKN